MNEDVSQLIMVVAVFLLAGAVKGVAGMGLPTVAMGLLGLWLPPSQAAALLVLPSLVTNLQQAWGPAATELLRRLWPVLAMVVAGTWLSAGLMIGGHPRYLRGARGPAGCLCPAGACPPAMDPAATSRALGQPADRPGRWPAQWRHRRAGPPGGAVPLCTGPATRGVDPRTGRVLRHGNACAGNRTGLARWRAALGRPAIAAGVAAHRAGSVGRYEAATPHLCRGIPPDIFGTLLLLGLQACWQAIA